VFLLIDNDLNTLLNITETILLQDGYINLKYIINFFPMFLVFSDIFVV